MTRLMKTLVLAVLCGGLVLKTALPATAQTHSQLQAQINALQAQNTALQAQIDALQSRMTDAEADIPDCMITGSGAGTVDDVLFVGCNVHVRNGQARTDSRNSVGNLIIGYNEILADFPVRVGSHNVVIGPQHSYLSYGGLVAGWGNTVSGHFASVSGGKDNEASGDFGSVSGGFNNEASDFAASVSGGKLNEASHRYANVSGGELNTASGFAASVSGGRNRTASGKHDWKAGGLFQTK